MTRKAFDPANYGEFWAPWLQRSTPHALDAPPADPDTASRLRKLKADALFADRQVSNPEMARCCLSGLLLLHDLLDASHAISQEIGSAEGSYWHGVMHRREGDYSNAKYWFRRVGRHPIHRSLQEEAESLRDRLAPQSPWPASPCEWSADAFVDRCEAAVTRDRDVALCRAIAEAEWRLLFDYCFEAAVR